jgi:hypothetical protein
MRTCVPELAKAPQDIYNILVGSEVKQLNRGVQPMPDLLELDQEDLRDLDNVADAFLRAGSSLDIDLVGMPKDFGEKFARLAEETVALSLGLAARLRPRWELYKQAGWNGQADQVHALRGSLLRSFEARLRHLAQAIRMASLAASLTGREVPGSARLPAAIQELTALKVEVFGRWKTLEDLEQFLVETYPLSAEQFDALATKCRPPTAWYQQEEQPF